MARTPGAKDRAPRKKPRRHGPYGDRVIPMPPIDSEYPHDRLMWAARAELQRQEARERTVTAGGRPRKGVTLTPREDCP